MPDSMAPLGAAPPLVSLTRPHGPTHGCWAGCRLTHCSW